MYVVEVEEEETAMEVLEMLRSSAMFRFLRVCGFANRLRKSAFQWLWAEPTYIHTIRSHLASREYMHSSQTYVRSSRQKFTTLALRTCREALRATRKVFFAAYRKISWHLLTAANVAE